MEKLSRRDFIQNTIGSVITLTLVDSLCKAEALTGSVKPIAYKWLSEMEQVSKSLKLQEIRPLEWQQQIESLLARVELSDLLKAIDYDRLAKHAVLPKDHESAEEINFSKIKGLPEELTFVPFFYAMKKGVAIVPHGHRNMTSMHMMLKGNAHGWHYSRVSDEPKHLIIKPTSDKLLVPGDASTISDERDNIHWFKAMSEPVFMFNVGIFGLNPKENFTGRDYIDPMNGERMKDGLIRAKRMEMEEAYKIYGKS